MSVRSVYVMSAARVVKQYEQSGALQLRLPRTVVAVAAEGISCSSVLPFPVALPRFLRKAQQPVAGAAQPAAQPAPGVPQSVSGAPRTAPQQIAERAPWPSAVPPKTVREQLPPRELRLDSDLEEADSRQD